MIFQKFLGNSINEDIPIIEINTEMEIEVGNVYQLKGKSEKMLPELWKALRENFLEFQKSSENGFHQKILKK